MAIGQWSNSGSQKRYNWQTIINAGSSQKAQKNVSIEIKATCPDGQVTEGLKAIVPQMELHSTLWHSKTGLPTIWVCKGNISEDISLKKINTLMFGTL